MNNELNTPVVALTRCDSYDSQPVADALQKQFSLLGGLERFVRRGDTVLIKPNMIAPKNRSCATQTDPAVIIETARILKDFGAKPFVGDSPAWSNVSACAKALGLTEPLKKMGVPLKQLGRPVRCTIAGDAVGISSYALEADKIINLPKFKSHQQLVATFAVKNMFGCVSGKKKALWHFARGRKEHDFCRLLIEVFKYLNPVVTIIDGIVAMDGPGPIRGRARPLGFLIGGTEPIACEMVCAELVNINPANLPIVAAARKMGFDCSDLRKIKIVGDGFPEKICCDFELPRLIPIRFSLTQVVKSVSKQVWLLAKAALGHR